MGTSSIKEGGAVTKWNADIMTKGKYYETKMVLRIYTHKISKKEDTLE